MENGPVIRRHRRRRNPNEEHQEKKRYLLNARREVRAAVDPLRIPDITFRSLFRVTKRLFRLLMREVTPYLPAYTGPLAVPNDVKVLCVLYFYATGSYQAPIGANFLTCVGRSTVGHFINEVTLALNNRELQRRWIRFPRTPAHREVMKGRHEREHGMPGIVGFVDGTEISIVKPPNDLNPQGFRTHKTHYALNCQVVSDSRMVILNVKDSYPGATNDAFIWKHSAVRRRMQEAFQEDQSSWLLGDSAYPLEPWMLVPILDFPEGSPEAHFTEIHCQARCSVERTFGILKGRWRCLLRDRKLHYAPGKCALIMKACCLLHNLCRLANLGDDDIEIPVGEEEPLYFVPRAGEVAAVEAAADDMLEAEFVVENGQDRNREHMFQLGTAIRQRVVNFLDIQRHHEH